MRALCAAGWRECELLCEKLGLEPVFPRGFLGLLKEALSQREVVAVAELGLGLVALALASALRRLPILALLPPSRANSGKRGLRSAAALAVSRLARGRLALVFVTPRELQAVGPPEWADWALVPAFCRGRVRASPAPPHKTPVVLVCSDGATAERLASSIRGAAFLIAGPEGAAAGPLAIAAVGPASELARSATVCLADEPSVECNELVGACASEGKLVVASEEVGAAAPWAIRGLARLYRPRGPEGALLALVTALNSLDEHKRALLRLRELGDYPPSVDPARALAGLVRARLAPSRERGGERLRASALSKWSPGPCPGAVSPASTARP